MYRYPTTHSSAEAFLYVANPPFFLPLSREGVFPALPPLRPQRTTASSSSVKKGVSLDSSMSSRSTMSCASARAARLVFKSYSTGLHGGAKKARRT